MSKTTLKAPFDFSVIPMRLSAVFSAFALGAYAYLGIFSRHLADDYCSVNFINKNFFSALWNNYNFVSDRFTNFMLIALSEFITPNSVGILPALMIILWAIGIAWLLYEASHFNEWDWSNSVIVTITLLFIFFALLQAPNRFQILYWRSAMATHFAPLVFMPFLASFILQSISSASKNQLPRWKYLLGFLIAFLIGGFSEPTAAVMITLLALAFTAAWLWVKSSNRKTALNLLICSLTGAMLAMLVMALSPANSFRLGTPPPALPILISRAFRYGIEFTLNSFRTLPLPTLFTVFMPFVIFYNLYASPSPKLTQLQQKHSYITLIFLPALSYLLIVASFFPSVYGQSYPVERARFTGQVSLVAGLMIEGALLGSLLAQWKINSIKNLSFKLISAILLGISALYPFRAAWITLAQAPEYRTRAQNWDAREATIYELRAQGQTELTIIQLDGVYGVKELDTYETHWVNKCASNYYGVKSIRAIQPK